MKLCLATQPSTGAKSPNLSSVRRDLDRILNRARPIVLMDLYPQFASNCFRFYI